MRRRHWHPPACTVCGVTNETAHISQRGLCLKCSLANKLDNNAQLEAGEGPYYEHWLMRSALALRRRVVAWEASQAEPQGVQSDG